MAYSKQWKVAQDYVFGIRDANRLRDNLEQIRTDLFVKHTGTIGIDPSISTAGGGGRGGLGGSRPSISPWGMQPPRIGTLGAHNEVLLNPFAVVYCEIAQQTAVNGSIVYSPAICLATEGFLDMNGFTRLAAGQYHLRSTNVDPTVHVGATAHSDMLGTGTTLFVESGSTLYAKARCYSEAEGAPLSGIYVTTYVASTASSWNLVPADLNFSLVVFKRS